jgi:glutathione S-transferase
MAMRIVGRSSSHFTRVVRMFAHELNVECAFVPVADLSSRNADHYANNPALKIPILETPDGPWFGALNICRELARRAPAPNEILWPEQLLDRKAANAQELVLQGMATEVALIMQAGSSGEIAITGKTFESLTNSLRWLDDNLTEVLATSSNGLSTLEVTTYCFVTHLEFRKVADVSTYQALQSFCLAFARRPSAQATPYRYDFSS